MVRSERLTGVEPAWSEAFVAGVDDVVLEFDGDSTPPGLLGGVIGLPTGICAATSEVKVATPANMLNETTLRINPLSPPFR
jgi:hypothetical protein